MKQIIKISLLDDSDFCPKHIKINNWSGEAFYSPRANLINILKQNEYEYFDFSSPGIYILKSDSSKDIYSEKIYIGQADVINSRIKQHLNSDKDFSEMVIFCGDDLHITNIRYIESKLINMANDCNNAEIENGNSPNEPNIDIVEKETMDYFIEYIKLILPIIGFNFLKQNKIKNDKIDINKTAKYYLKSKRRIVAKLIETNEGFIVLKDSEASKKVADSLGQAIINIRKKYIENKVLIEENGKYIFAENINFNSLSTAASVILGTRVSGPKYWQDSNGKAYSEINK
jgi:hypothetical protein